MSTFKLPEAWPQCARVLIERVEAHADAHGNVPGEGDPPNCITKMMSLTALSRRTVYRALTFLKGESLVEVWYEGRHLRVRLCVELLEREAGFCAECGVPTEGAGRWCAAHKQRVGRQDRRWQTAAEVLLECAVDPLRIAVLLKREPWRGSADDGRHPGGGAVVPYLIGKGLLGPEWAERLRVATRGHVDE